MIKVVKDMENTQAIEAEGKSLLYFKNADVYLSRSSDGLSVYADPYKYCRIQGSHPGFISIPDGTISTYERMLRSLKDTAARKDTAAFIFYFVYHSLRNFVMLDKGILHEIGEWDEMLAHLDELVEVVRLYPDLQSIREAHPEVGDVANTKYKWIYYKARPLTDHQKEMIPTAKVMLQPNCMLLECERGILMMPIYQKMLSSDLYLLGAAQVMFYRLGIGSVHQSTWNACNRWESIGESQVVSMHDSTYRNKFDHFLMDISKRFV